MFIKEDYLYLKIQYEIYAYKQTVLEFVLIWQHIHNKMFYSCFRWICPNPRILMAMFSLMLIFIHRFSTFKLLGSVFWKHSQ